MNILAAARTNTGLKILAIVLLTALWPSFSGAAQSATGILGFWYDSTGYGCAFHFSADESEDYCPGGHRDIKRVRISYVGNEIRLEDASGNIQVYVWIDRSTLRDASESFDYILKRCPKNTLEECAQLSGH
ncbi:MAG TPA: hypothetical protein VII56_03455 [Rhizomicrobium sp.]